jgi:hypothetical protein
VSHYFVLAIGHKERSDDDQVAAQRGHSLVDLVDSAIRQAFGPKPRDILASVSPGGLMLAIPDDTVDRAAKLVDSLARMAVHENLTICCAVANGALLELAETWLARNFEGPAAIVAARILAKLEPGALGIHAKAAEYWPRADQWERAWIAGKHDGERFEIRTNLEVFPDREQDSAAGAPPAAGRVGMGSPPPESTGSPLFYLDNELRKDLRNKVYLPIDVPVSLLIDEVCRQLELRSQLAVEGLEIRLRYVLEWNGVPLHRKRSLVDQGIQPSETLTIGVRYKVLGPDGKKLVDGKTYRSDNDKAAWLGQRGASLLALALGRAAERER